MAQHASPFFHSLPGWDVAVKSAYNGQVCGEWKRLGDNLKGDEMRKMGT